MIRHTVSTMLFAGVAAAALASGACNRGEEAKTTTPEVQSQTTQPASTPMTVAGCVKAGEAADTYVLTAARAEGNSETATYQLVGEQTDALKDQIGKQVQVTGTLEAQSQIASSSTATAPKESATGTAGTPTVQTRTSLEINRLTVTGVTPLGDKCDM